MLLPGEQVCRFFLFLFSSSIFLLFLLKISNRLVNLSNDRRYQQSSPRCSENNGAAFCRYSFRRLIIFSARSHPRPRRRRATTGSRNNRPPRYHLSSPCPTPH